MISGIRSHFHWAGWELDGRPLPPYDYKFFSGTLGLLLNETVDATLYPISTKHRIRGIDYSDHIDQSCIEFLQVLSYPNTTDRVDFVERVSSVYDLNSWLLLGVTFCTVIFVLSRIFQKTYSLYRVFYEAIREILNETTIRANNLLERISYLFFSITFFYITVHAFNLVNTDFVIPYGKVYHSYAQLFTAKNLHILYGLNGPVQANTEDPRRIEHVLWWHVHLKGKQQKLNQSVIWDTLSFVGEFDQHRRKTLIFPETNWVMNFVTRILCYVSKAMDYDLKPSSVRRTRTNEQSYPFAYAVRDGLHPKVKDIIKKA